MVSNLHLLSLRGLSMNRQISVLMVVLSITGASGEALANGDPNEVAKVQTIAVRQSPLCRFTGNDVMKIVLSDLDLQSLISISRVSHYFNELAKDKDVLLSARKVPTYELPISSFEVRLDWLSEKGMYILKQVEDKSLFTGVLSGFIISFLAVDLATDFMITALHPSLISIAVDQQFYLDQFHKDREVIELKKSIYPIVIPALSLTALASHVINKGAIQLRSTLKQGIKNRKNKRIHWLE